VLFVSLSAAKAVATARAYALPREACGFLLGMQRDDGIAVTDVVVSRTSSAAYGAFEIPDVELRRVKAWGEERHLQIVAVFHSHPSGDRRLSDADRAALRHSEWPWVVVTRLNGDTAAVLTAYRAGDGAAIAIRVVDPACPDERDARTSR
jgi:proteasome lid subunit RPN8/RPN11